MLSDVFSKALQAINIVLTVIGILICIGGIIYGSLKSLSLVIVGGSLLLVNHIKSLLDYTYFYGKMRQIANNLRESVKFFEVQNKKLSENVSELNRIKDEMHLETNKLANIVKSSEKQINELSEIKNDLERGTADLTKTNIELVALRDQYHEENMLLSENIKKSESELLIIKGLKEAYEKELNDLNNKLDHLDIEIGDLRETNISLESTKDELENQLEELKNLYIESKKLIKNLVLAGDQFGEFEKKFAETASSLKVTETSISSSTSELKETAKLLGTMVNSLASKVPEGKQHLAQRSEVAEKFQNLVSQALKQKREEL